MWKHIQDHAVVNDERKKWVLQSLGKKYRDYKKDHKDKYYFPWNTDEERLQHLPRRFSRRLGLACAILGQSKGSGCGFEK
ncbi:hypothetical protein MRB53_028403 [Persea americana]|uniref:Uncharacterized protein n=1 Tax=Persea americana TaxID=3435 RepID=A0ACC2KFY4_PERAE|nr:hypothetical protein MRB53_028403 [Persea americana]